MVFIGTAAVADYGVAKTSDQKLKKQHNATLSLHLVPNPDIISAVVETGKAQFVVGFAAETDDVIAHAREKLQAKGLNMIVANQVGLGLGFDSDVNQATILTKDSETELPEAHKVRLAGQIIAIIAARLQNVAQHTTEK